MLKDKVYLSIGSYLDGELILDLSDNTLDYLSNKEIEEAKKLGFTINHAKVCNEATRKALSFGQQLNSLNSNELPTTTVDAIKQRKITIQKSNGVFSPEILDNIKLIDNATSIEPDNKLAMDYVDYLYDRHENNVREFIKELDKDEFIDYMGLCGLKKKTLGKDDFGEYNMELLPREESAKLVIDKFNMRDSMHEIVASIKGIGKKISFVDLHQDTDIEQIIANNLCFVLQQKINGSTSFICTNNKQILDVMYGDNVVETLYALPATKAIVNEPRKRNNKDNTGFSVFSGSLRVKNDKDEPYVSSLCYTVVPNRVSAIAIIQDINYNDLLKNLTPDVILPNYLTFNGKCDTLYYNDKDFSDLRSAIESGYVESYLKNKPGSNSDYIRVVANKINKMRGIIPSGK